LESSFKKIVYELVSGIKPGKVMTYGQIAALSGSARASRIVGGLAHYGDTNLPWHRVVNKIGGLASGFPGGREAHKKLLENEGYSFIEKDGLYYVDLYRHLRREFDE
jgi:methylated-DNA-protein-cysteine methyltransferase-like protein